MNSTPVKIPLHSHCIVCGKNSFFSGLFFTGCPDGSVESFFNADHCLQGYSGILHGGIISSLLDSAMTHCLSMHNVPALTGEMNIRFRKPVQCGTMLHITARICDSLPPLYSLKARICCDGITYAEACGKFMHAIFERNRNEN